MSQFPSRSMPCRCGRTHFFLGIMATIRCGQVSTTQIRKWGSGYDRREYSQFCTNCTERGQGWRHPVSVPTQYFRLNGVSLLGVSDLFHVNRYAEDWGIHYFGARFTVLTA